MDLALSPARSATSLARWRTNSRSSRTSGGAIRLGQPAHPQEVGQIGGIERVVLDRR
jgi:hypothetical protein